MAATDPPDRPDARGPPGVTPEASTPALRGDLETIVAKALKKSPAERYAVRPVPGRRPAPLPGPRADRRPARCVRVSRGPFRAAAPVAGGLRGLVLLAVVGGLAGTLWQARVAARERDAAIAQLDRAGSINEFTGYLLGEAFPGGEPVSVRDILARAEKLAENRATSDVTLAVDLLVSIGDIYVVRDETDNAKRTLKRAYELSQSLDDPTTRAKATCAWALPVGMGGDQEGALRLIEEGLALTTADERFDGVAATCLLGRTSIGMQRDSARIVSDSAREALRRVDRRPHAHPELRAASLQMVAMGHRLAGETFEADLMFARALEQLRILAREESIDAATLLSNWATNTALTSPLAALEQNRRVVAIFEGSAPDSVPLPALQNYALQLSRVARYAEARMVVERAQRVARQHAHAQGIGLSEVRLAQVCRELGDLGCARETLRAAERDVSAAYPAGHRTRGDLAREQALLAEAEGRDRDAHRLMLEAASIHGKLKDRNLTQIETLLELSRLELRLGSAHEAESRAREALAIAEVFRGEAPHSSWVGRSLLAIGAARQAQADAAGARELVTQALAHMTPTLGADHPAVASARQGLAR